MSEFYMLKKHSAYFLFYVTLSFCLGAANTPMTKIEKESIIEKVKNYYAGIQQIIFDEDATISGTVLFKRNIKFDTKTKKLLLTEKSGLLDGPPSKAIKSAYFSPGGSLITMEGFVSDDSVIDFCGSHVEYTSNMWQCAVADLHFFHFSGLLSDGINAPIDILDLLGDSQTSWGYDSLDKECFRISATRGIIDATIWIDIENSFIWKVLLKRNNVNQASSSYYVSREYSVLERQLIDGTFFPKNLEVRERYPAGMLDYSQESQKEQEKQLKDMGVSLKLPGRNISQSISFYNVNFVNNLTSQDFSIDGKIPNGTPVSMQDAPQLQYVWLDGKIVPKTDEVALRIARGGHKFMPGPDEPRFWLMGVGIALIVFALGVKAYKMYKGIPT